MTRVRSSTLSSVLLVWLHELFPSPCSQCWGWATGTGNKVVALHRRLFKVLTQDWWYCYAVVSELENIADPQQSFCNYLKRGI